MPDVILSDIALNDLHSIFDWLEPETGATFARDYIRQIRDQCRSLADFPNRGRPHDHILTGMRTIGFERKATIVYIVEAEQVRILRVLHRGRDIDRSFDR